MTFLPVIETIEREFTTPAKRNSKLFLFAATVMYTVLPAILNTVAILRPNLLTVSSSKILFQNNVQFELNNANSRIHIFFQKIHPQVKKFKYFFMLQIKFWV